MTSGPFVGAARIVLHIPGAQTLKDRRQVVASLRDRLRARTGLSVAEIPSGESPKRQVLALGGVGSDGADLRATLDRAVSLAAHGAEALVVDVDVQVVPWPLSFSSSG